LCGNCNGLLKPDFVFFGEPIPQRAQARAFQEAQLSDVFLLIGTTGEVMPAAMVPAAAKNNGAVIIEMNVEPSLYTDHITDVFLQAKATEAVTRLLEALELV
ncbi:MAG: RNA polymerase subunit sigma, partial [Candidatus Zixiibacteriota bacterium]